MKQNNELIHFLNSVVICEVNYVSGKVQKPLTFETIKYFVDSEGVLSKDVKPILYPLSCLTETITHEGVDEIPLVELAKIEGFYREDMSICINTDNSISFSYSNGVIFQFGFHNKINSFELYDESDNMFLLVSNQLLLFQYLFSRRINPFPKLEAIDPRELGDNNPYLITNKK